MVAAGSFPVEPRRSRYRRLERGWKGSARTAQPAVSSHPPPRVPRRSSPGEWGRPGGPDTPSFAAPPPVWGRWTDPRWRHGERPAGGWPHPLPLPGPSGRLPVGLTPRAAPPAPSLRLRGPPGAAPVRGSPAAPPARAPGARRLLGPPALRGHCAPAASAPARRGLLARPPPLPEGHQFDFTGIRHRSP